MNKTSTINIEVAISRILQISVTVSIMTILLGLVLLFTQQGHGGLRAAASYHSFVSTSYSFPHSFSALEKSVRAREGIGIIVLGILLLIITPIIRVGTSFLLFVRKRDRPMTLVTIFVLLILIGSFYLGIVK